MTSQTSSPPVPTEPDASWPHFDLWRAVRATLYALPSRFESDLVISGVLASDLYQFNSSLGGTIEEQVVTSLNKLRETWDPSNKYALYQFERQPQTFPDVVLRTQAPGLNPSIIMGIELKGWYILAKEGEPSFRHKVTPAVCAPQDLIAIVPWALSRVVSGSPKVFMPFVSGARYAAEMRNWYWANRGGSANPGITVSSFSAHYPQKSDQINDRPASDSGGNFGRVSRSGLMDEYLKEIETERLVGVPIVAWREFLKQYS